MLLLVLSIAAGACSHSTRRAATRRARGGAARRAPAKQHVKVEIARTDPERQRGLMYRQTLEPRSRHDLLVRASGAAQVLDEEHLHSARHDLHRRRQAGRLRRRERRAADATRRAAPTRIRSSCWRSRAGGHARTASSAAWPSSSSTSIRRETHAHRDRTLLHRSSSVPALADTAAGAGDPVANHTISLEDATKGVKGSGALMAKIDVEQAGKTLGTLHLRAVRQAGAQDRRQLRRPRARRAAVEGSEDRRVGQEAAVRRHRLPPRDPRVHDPGRRSQGQRHRRSRLRVRRRVRSVADDGQGRHAGDGQSRAGHQRLAVLHHREGDAVAQRQAHHLRRSARRSTSSSRSRACRRARATCRTIR